MNFSNVVSLVPPFSLKEQTSQLLTEESIITKLQNLTLFDKESEHRFSPHLSSLPKDAYTFPQESLNQYSDLDLQGTSKEIRFIIEKLSIITKKLKTLNPKQLSQLNEPLNEIKSSFLGNWFLYIPNFPTNLSPSSLLNFVQLQNIKILDFTIKIKGDTKEAFLKLWTDQTKVQELVYNKQVIQNQEIRFFFAKKPAWLTKLLKFKRSNKNPNQKNTLDEDKSKVNLLSQTKKDPIIQDDQITIKNTKNLNLIEIEPHTKDESLQNLKTNRSDRSLPDEILKAICGFTWKSYTLMKLQSKTINSSIEKLEKYFIKKTNQSKHSTARKQLNAPDSKMIIEQEGQKESHKDLSITIEKKDRIRTFPEELSFNFAAQPSITIKATAINFQAPSSITLDLDSDSTQKNQTKHQQRKFTQVKRKIEHPTRPN